MASTSFARLELARRQLQQRRRAGRRARLGDQVEPLAVARCDRHGTELAELVDRALQVGDPLERS